MGKVEDSIEKIMQATVRVAFEKGFSNTRTADIAKEAGVSEGLIFKYFPTKNKLFAIIIKENFKRLQAGITLIIENQSLTATGKINALIDYHFDFFANQRNIAQLLFGHSDRKSIGDVEPIIEYAIKPYVQLVMKILNEGINSGEFRFLQPEVISVALIATMQLSVITSILFNHQSELGTTKNEIKEYILSGIKAN
jgi:TetR/AcrR family transcriptional regulator, fatty acid metabolism regulator protein